MKMHSMKRPKAEVLDRSMELQVLKMGHDDPDDYDGAFREASK